MNTNDDAVIIPSETTTKTTVKSKSKKPKKKNKLVAAADQTIRTEIVAIDSIGVSEVSSDLQNRLRLADAEDSGFGEANGHDDHNAIVLENVECVEPTPAVRSGPDDDVDDHHPDDCTKTDESLLLNCCPATEHRSCSTKSAVAEESQPHIEYVSYENELQMPDIMRLIQKDLSEPYSIYTYRYFIHNWPKLCFLSMHDDKCVGAIVCKLDIHRQNIKRGYIAMLAVDKDYRKLKIGTQLVQNAINVSLLFNCFSISNLQFFFFFFCITQAMLAFNADEVVLETEITNIPALRLYENLGFVRDKRLFGYYLNGVDALRLKLWFR